MKKKLPNLIPIPKSGIIKIVRTMKLALIIVFLSVLQVSANVYSQVTVNLDVQDKPIREVLKTIEQQSQVRFFYSDDLLVMSELIDVKADNKNIIGVLDDIFSKSPLTYKAYDNNLIVIAPRDLLQQKKVTGTVTAKDGTPLPGVNVVVTGTTMGTLTDAAGKYSIEVPQGSKSLTFSFIGMEAQEITIGTLTEINVTMLESAVGLEEVVVVGYGTIKKKDITGSVASLGREEIESRPILTFEDALKGRISGVQVRQTGGDLAGDFSISIRGVGSVNGTNDPLIVVDGVPLFSSDFSTINPKDIQSMDVLKDASATAIYGARAANGVIMITTKQGRKGELRLTLDVDLGFEQISKMYEVMSTEQQRLLFVEAFTNSGRSTAVYDDPTNPIWQIDTDWQEEGTQTAFRQNYNLGFGGGSENTNYSGSFSYLNREGTLKSTDFQQYSLRLNVSSQFNKYLKLSTNLTGSHQEENYADADSWGAVGYRGFLQNHSYTEPYDENGELTAVNTTAAPYFGSNSNPLIDLLLPTKTRNVNRILGNTKLDVTLLDGLVLSGNFGGDIVLRDGYAYNPVYSIGRFSRDQGDVTVNAAQQVNWVGDITLDYDKQFGAHNIKALAGFSVQQYKQTNTNTSGAGTIDNQLNQLSNQTDFGATGTDVTSGLVSYFGRAIYNYGDKYYLTGTVRYDGSSRFGADNRYGVFPSGSVAWRISEESFLQSIDILDDLKLRVGYGLTGNQDIGDFAFITKAGSAQYVFGNSVVVGNAPENIGNPNLKWESNVQFGVGIDLSLFKGRIYSSIDYYDKQSQDLLISTPIPLTAGVSVNPIVNLGSFQNTGVEFALNTRNIEGDFSWTTSFNISFNKNKVIDIGTNSLGEPLEIPGEQIPLAWAPANLTRAGQEAAGFYMYTWDGVWQLGEEAEAAAWDGPAQPGDPKYVDLNGNGIFDAGDKSFVGTPQPKYFGGMDNTFSYKNLSLSVFLEFAGGYKVYNTARNLLARSVPFVHNFAEVADFWTPENPSNVSRPSQGGYTTSQTNIVSTRWLEDGSYLKIKNIRLSYLLPAESIKGDFINSAKFTLTASNFFTFTKYTGLDPEASSRNDLLSQGLDFTPYPPTKLISLAIQVNF